jgi:hypothetical protein
MVAMAMAVSKYEAIDQYSSAQKTELHKFRAPLGEKGSRMGEKGRGMNR